MTDEAFNPHLPIAGLRPAIMFFPADHERDVALNSVSLAAQGMFMRVLCLMHRCRPYGHLAINGVAMTPKQLGQELHCTRGKAMKLIGELLTAKVLHRDDEGVIYQKRMVRDEYRKQIQAEAGKAGAEHGHKGAEYGVLGGRPTKAQILARKLAETALAEPEGSYPKPPPSIAVSSSGSSLLSSAPAASDEKETRKTEIVKAQAKVQATVDQVCAVLREFGVSKVKPHAVELHTLVRSGVDAAEVRSACEYVRELEREGQSPKGANYVYAVVTGWRADAEQKRLAAEAMAARETGGGVMESAAPDDVTDVVAKPETARSRARRKAAKADAPVTVPSTMTGTTTFQDPTVPAPVPESVKAFKAKLRNRAKPPVPVEKTETAGESVDAS